MPKVSYTWNSTQRDIYHNNTACTEGNNIETLYFQYGTGGKRLCEHCAALNARGQ